MIENIRQGLKMFVEENWHQFLLVGLPYLGVSAYLLSAFSQGIAKGMKRKLCVLFYFGGAGFVFWWSLHWGNGWKTFWGIVIILIPLIELPAWPCYDREFLHL